jgi:hypothetical protein
MSDPVFGKGSLQFETVEYAPAAGGCVLCNQPIGGTYYRVNGEQACAACVEKERSAQSISHKYYSRALLYGIGAAIVGMIGYAVFEIATDWIIGYVSLAVGWLVGKAMLKGSNGFGGRRYQITAVLLTYAAVSTAAVPVMINQVIKHKQSQPQVQKAGPAETNSDSTTTAAPDSGNPQSAEQPATQKPEPKMEIGKALGLLVLIGLASPFLELADPLHGIIGLFILFIGMQIAWKMTGRPKLIIDGPF